MYGLDMTAQLDSVVFDATLDKNVRRTAQTAHSSDTVADQIGCTWSPPVHWPGLIPDFRHRAHFGLHHLVTHRHHSRRMVASLLDISFAISLLLPTLVRRFPSSSRNG